MVKNRNRILTVVFDKTFYCDTRSRGPIVFYPKDIMVTLGITVVFIDKASKVDTFETRINAILSH